MAKKGYLLEEKTREPIEQPIELEGDTMVTADYHVPLHDIAFCNEMISKARKEGIDQLVIGGDFFNFDALSTFLPKQDSAGLREEHEEALDVMETLLRTFSNIVYIWGNHDNRLVKALGFQLTFEESIKLVFGGLGKKALSQITFSNLDHCYVTSMGERFYICHPQRYTATPLYTAKTLSTKFNCNVITAHSHHCAVAHSIDGKKVLAEAGGLFDKDRTEYLQRSTTHPVWQQGFAYIKDGKLKVVSPKWSLEE